MEGTVLEGSFVEVTTTSGRVLGVVAGCWASTSPAERKAVRSEK
jgi:hypothetical protein